MNAFSRADERSWSSFLQREPLLHVLRARAETGSSKRWPTHTGDEPPHDVLFLNSFFQRILLLLISQDDEANSDQAQYMILAHNRCTFVREVR